MTSGGIIGSSVLVIDDDLELLRQMSMALASVGFAVQIATDGGAGLKRFGLCVEAFDHLVACFLFRRHWPGAQQVGGAPTRV